MSHDPFSDVLRLTDASTVVSGGLRAGGAWAVHFPAPHRIKLFAVARGQCWVRVGKQKRATKMEEGDVFLFRGREDFLVTSNLTAKVTSARSLYRDGRSVPTIGNGADCWLIGGMVSLHPAGSALLTDVLPPLVHVRAASPEAAALRWLFEQMMREHGSTLPGAEVACAQLAQLVFVHVMRAHLASAGALPSGWLRAVRDERIGPALRAMHAEPGRGWRLAELAKIAAMSRTSFAVRFKAVAGVAPLEYLTEWRMRLAQKRLREDDASVLELATSLGYRSESAFSNAFKRVTGHAPRHYRRAAREGRAESALEAGPHTRASA
ncbi:AraC family transcriptional regulator [Sandaracinus amylolyticus]|uniref:AraC family transcriptional regulator n=1 Tax=Sandaracinus amylolyticus TaxID=927083 RepID=UPI001F1D0B89|nr:cupin domain-containing protein [Sandaracinus amylolyticus]UJR85647.1 Hypothetical protein I5071_77270 [Sandaracinus amylolyticus]